MKSLAIVSQLSQIEQSFPTVIETLAHTIEEYCMLQHYQEYSMQPHYHTHFFVPYFVVDLEVPFTLRSLLIMNAPERIVSIISIFLTNRNLYYFGRAN